MRDLCGIVAFSILTGLANLSTKYFFILLQRIQKKNVRVVHFTFGSVNWLYQKIVVSNFRIYSVSHYRMCWLCHSLCTRLRKGCRMQFNLLVGSYLIYLLLAIKAEKKQTNIDTALFGALSVVPLPNNCAKGNEENCVIPRSQFSFVRSLISFADYIIVQQKKHTAHKYVCVLIVICIHTFIWHFVIDSSSFCFSSSCLLSLCIFAFATHMQSMRASEKSSAQQWKVCRWQKRERNRDTHWRKADIGGGKSNGLKQIDFCLIFLRKAQERKRDEANTKWIYSFSDFCHSRIGRQYFR